MPKGLPVSHRPGGNGHVLVMNPDHNADLNDGPPNLSRAVFLQGRASFLSMVYSRPMIGRLFRRPESQRVEVPLPATGERIFAVGDIQCNNQNNPVALFGSSKARTIGKLKVYKHAKG